MSDSHRNDVEQKSTYCVIPFTCTSTIDRASLQCKKALYLLPWAAQVAGKGHNGASGGMAVFPALDGELLTQLHAFAIIQITSDLSFHGI